MSVGGALSKVWFSKADLADELGVSIHSVRSWALNRRVPEPETARRIAKAFRKHAKKLIVAAERLERRSQ